MTGRLLLTFSVLIAGASESFADCRGIRRAIAVKQVAVVQKQTLLVAPVVPFTAAYGGVGYNQSYSPEYAAVLQKLARIEALLATGVVQSKTPAPQQTQPPMQPAVNGGQPAVFASKCVACHGPTAKPGLTFFDANGSYVSDRCEVPGLMLSKIILGEMPPPNNKQGIPQVTDEEAGTLPDWIKSLPSPKR